ncbi:hypothetical protein PVL29_015402 [Vitis rotundifolia]|uniref:Fatty acid hydroperoxide lyase n=1 Tax=Vitis rotundifolia TaxID=103349 RepID=A0AA38ZCG1_VITRO|nr:hypothetical protein PVL29_015402 [Vitis rotundifolia]
MLSSTVMSVSPGVPTPSSLTPPAPPSSCPVRTIPGSYGWPVLGPIADRLDYFWFQGPETFFRKRIDKYKSTVFRTNVPPSFPFFVDVNPNVIAVLDCKSFSFLFDMDVVEKKNVLVGDFMPSVKYTGGIRVCAYLDTAETQHARVKSFAMDILKRSSSIWASEVVASLDSMWDTIDASVAKSNSTSYIKPLQRFIFQFLTKCLVGADPSVSPEIAESGYVMLDKWVFLQLLPTISVNFLQPLEEIFLHSFAYPFFLVKGDYRKLYDFVEQHGQAVLQRGETEFNLSKEETIHNLLFVLGFNAFGGFTIFFPSLLSALSGKPELQAKLREEVRSKIKPGTNLTFESVKDLELVHSVVYETLRLNPPVPLQYARARKDFQLSSHDSVFEIKKGDLLCGYQKVAMTDPKIFDDPETFVPDRFTKEKGRELLNYLFWSNGPQTGSPSDRNKQCAAKDYVTMTAVLFVAHMFQRYDSVTASGSSVTALEKAK